MITTIRKIKQRIDQIISKRNNSETIFIEKNKFLKFLPKNPIIIDCGAHVGLDSIEFSKIPGSTVYAFEPVDEVYVKLIENVKLIKNIKPCKIALSDYDGAGLMYVSSGDSDGSSSLLKPKKHLKDHPNVFFNTQQKVECKMLHTWANDNNIVRIDMLWLDMQGAEQKMLSASKSILDTVKIIHTEVNLHETYEGIESYKSFKTFLKKKGFKIIVEAIPKGNYGGNVLFIRND